MKAVYKLENESQYDFYNNLHHVWGAPACRRSRLAAEMTPGVRPQRGVANRSFFRNCPGALAAIRTLRLKRALGLPG